MVLFVSVIINACKPSVLLLVAMGDLNIRMHVVVTGEFLVLVCCRHKFKYIKYAVFTIWQQQFVFNLLTVENNRH